MPVRSGYKQFLTYPNIHTHKCYNSAGLSDDKSREALERSSGMTLSRMDFSVVLMRSVLATSGSLSFSHTRRLSKGLILR